MFRCVRRCAARARPVLVAAFFVVGVARASSAEVVEVSASGFTVRAVLEIAAPAATVYDALTGAVGQWWDPAHTWSGQSANLSIDPRPGGCFCEKLPAGGVQHMIVVYADRGAMLRMAGLLGPLQSMPGQGIWVLAFSESGGRTRLEATYGVLVHGGGDLKALAPAVDQVMGGQAARLKRYVEGGRP